MMRDDRYEAAVGLPAGTLPREPVVGFNLGSDSTFSIIDPFHRPIRSRVIGAVIRKIRAHDGEPELWEVALTFNREGGEIDYLFGEIEQRQTHGDEAMHFAILQSTMNPDGTISQYQFPKLTGFYESAGEYAASEDPVRLRVVFRGKRRTIVQ